MNFIGQTGERMSCPRCGAAMNHHADKTLYFTEVAENRSTDSATGLVEEIHACPNCGASASRTGRE